MGHGHVLLAETKTKETDGTFCSCSSCSSLSEIATCGNKTTLSCSSRRAAAPQAGPPGRQTAAPPPAPPDLWWTHTQSYNYRLAPDKVTEDLFTDVLQMFSALLPTMYSLWYWMGPLSTLPPSPGFSQKGGAQPRLQWQFPLLLHTCTHTHTKETLVIMWSSVGFAEMH